MSLSVTDLFCGAGGSSIGAELAGAELRLGLNHWQRAIETHATNFPHADHDCEDVSSLTTAQIRRYPDSDILLASPECTNHSLAKGARRRKPRAASLFDDGPAGDDEQDRSRATMWDVVRFAEQKLLKGRPYSAIVVENVVDAFKWGADDNGQLFAAWRFALESLGYESEIVWLNSMFCPPTPQSRDRMYVFFWRKGVRRPNLRFEPTSWCPSCERLVEGRQSWKRPDRPWGRYGAQYVYRCPSCNGVVLPGVFPAASAIDWTIEAQIIGARSVCTGGHIGVVIRNNTGASSAGRGTALLRFAKTRARSSVPWTVSIGCVSERRARLPGVRSKVLPATGITIARSWRPVTVTMGSVRGRGAPPCMSRIAKGSDARRSRPRRIRARVFSASGRTRSPRGDAGQMASPVHEPFRTLTASCTQSLVVPYQSAPHGAEEPLRTVTTRDRLALIVPPMGDVVPRDASREPAPTQTTTTRAALVEVADSEIDRCGFRMFDLQEIARTMAMDRHPRDGDYVVLGNKRERMAQYGNAVTPPVAHEGVARLAEALA